jgi:hypothetical protein
LAIYINTRRINNNSNNNNKQEHMKVCRSSRLLDCVCIGDSTPDDITEESFLPLEERLFGGQVVQRLLEYEF